MVERSLRFSSKEDIMHYIPIFDIPIFLHKAKNHDKIKSWIMKNAYPDYEKNGPNSDSLANVYSDYFENAVQTDQKLMMELYQEDFNSLFEFLNFPKNEWTVKPYFWYNFTGKGGYQEQHCHITSPLPVVFSAIHYIKFDPTQHRSASFLHPNEQIIRATYPSERMDLVPDYFKHLSRNPNVEEGDIIFFPSWLKHVVEKQQSEELRISMAINIGIFDRQVFKGI